MSRAVLVQGIIDSLHVWKTKAVQDDWLMLSYDKLASIPNTSRVNIFVGSVSR